MNSSKDKIKSFTDLNAWKEAHKLVLMVYRITKKIPSEELFCLTSQIRRATISITSNIAEGFSRNFNKEKAQFYTVALGSLTELQNQILAARDIGYIPKEDFTLMADQTIVVSKLINGLIKSTRNNIIHNS
ncbi:four helix bundle protein [Candidatus Microgenomates bacterium]|nr:four helix bundle protein [Candidatus Microgenomates bacterium]